MQDSGLTKQIALSRIERLVDLAKVNLKSNRGSDALAKRYIRLAKKIASHYRVKIPKKLDDYICKKCNTFLIPGINARVRLASSKRYIIYKCECGKEAHIFYK